MKIQIIMIGELSVLIGTSTLPFQDPENLIEKELARLWELKGGAESCGMLSPGYDISKAIINTALWLHARDPQGTYGTRVGDI